MFTASGLGRVRGTFLHSNPFAAYLFLMIILAVSLYPHVERRWKLVLGPLMVACGVCLTATYTRGAWAATVLALVVVGLLQDRRILWLLGATSIVAVLAIPSIGVRLSDLTESQKESGAPGNSLVWRLQYWQQVLALQDESVVRYRIQRGRARSNRRERSSAQRPDPHLRGDGLPRSRGLRVVLITLGVQPAPPSRGPRPAFLKDSPSPSPRRWRASFS